MASNVPTRSLRILSRRSQECCACGGYKTTSRINRQFSSSASRLDESPQQSTPTDRPRWSYTPPQMKAPFNPRIKDPAKAWDVKSDPAKVNAMYNKFLGRGGDKLLSDEIKWLAITHKSFDQGRRGFNDRLAFFGKRILVLQSTLSVLHSADNTSTQSHHQDPYGRSPFQHPDLDGLPNLNAIDMSQILTKQRLARLATSYGIAGVTRWKPRNPANMEGSGSEVVYATSLYAIIGALALQRGGEVANGVAREKVLKPLGIL